jgi:hypothetical protein
VRIEGSRKFVRRIGGRDVTTELRLEDLSLSSDISREASSVAGLMGLAGELMAHTVEQLTLVDAGYRGWRAATAKKVLDADPKTAEWKVKLEIESDPKFIEWKNSIGQLEGDLEYLRAYMSSLQVKASMIRATIEQSKIGDYGAALGIETGSRETPSDEEETPRVRRTPMRAPAGGGDRDDRIGRAMSKGKED